MQDAAQHPALLYVVLGVSILITISGAVPKILGPLGEAFKARAEAARAAAADADDADIKELHRQIQNLTLLLEQERIAARAEREASRLALVEEQKAVAEHRRLVGDLYRWILAAQHDPKNLQRPVPEPN